MVALVGRMIEAVKETGEYQTMEFKFPDDNEREIEDDIKRLHSWHYTDSVRVRVSYKIENERTQYNPWCQKFFKHGDFTVTVDVCPRAVPTKTLAGGAECQYSRGQRMPWEFATRERLNRFPPFLRYPHALHTRVLGKSSREWLGDSNCVESVILGTTPNPHLDCDGFPHGQGRVLTKADGFRRFRDVLRKGYHQAGQRRRKVELCRWSVVRFPPLHPHRPTNWSRFVKGPRKTPLMSIPCPSRGWCVVRRWGTRRAGETRHTSKFQAQ